MNRSKKLFGLLLALTLTFSGCGGTQEPSENIPSETPVQSQADVGGAAAEFTPKLAIQPVTGIYAPGFIAYCAYLFIPSALHMKEAVQWHISRSRI